MPQPRKPIIQTERLILRQWVEEDLEPFAELNADTRVMKYLPSVLSRQESEERMKRMQKKIDESGWGWWAVSRIEDEQFIGVIGMDFVDKVILPAQSTPAVEVGWRLAHPFWGKGYATEGALACLKYGFEVLNLDEIVALTAVQNTPSRKVMERIGMHHDPKDDFDHPKLPEGHSLRRHVLYRLKHSEWGIHNAL